MREIDVTKKLGKGEKMKVLKGKCKQYDSVAEAEKDMGKDENGVLKALKFINSKLVLAKQSELARGQAVPSVARIVAKALADPKTPTATKEKLEAYLKKEGFIS